MDRSTPRTAYPESTAAGRHVKPPAGVAVILGTASCAYGYVLAYHRRAANAQQLNEHHRDLKRRYRWADPEVILKGTPEWEAYHDAELAARVDKTSDLKSRIKAVEQTGDALLDAIGKRRSGARRDNGKRER